MSHLSTIAVGLNAQQRAMVDIIEREFTTKGHGASVTAAAVVNAYAESRLDPLAVGDGGKSVGLFQLRSPGAGSGMTVAERQDPVLNTRRILSEYVIFGKRVEAARLAGADLGTLTALFCRDVERPDNKDVKAAERAAMARRLFPQGPEPQGSVTANSSLQLPVAKTWAAWSAVGLLSLGALWWMNRRGRRSA